jgi:5'-3' exonuclease
MSDDVQHLLPIYRASTAILDSTSLVVKHKNLAWVTNAVTRLRVIGEEVSSIEQALPSATTDIDFEDVPPKTAMYTGPDVQNVIIDGLNLAIRCLFAPGLGELRDSNGRPTGVYIGFLRSLGSLAKRWPTARLHVCWDGSSKRRKEAFPGYKADRPELPLRVEEVEWLREALPKFGVFQSWNRSEEADDAIATLVKSTFAKQQNVFMSTDKDLFQLVSDTDLFLYPAVGKARETLYNSAGVAEKWGVPPERLVTLRAMLGDSSDRIPGVPGVPQKVLVNLVRAYGTVDKIFASNLAGLSKLQYEKLIASEAIIRRNVDLMTLRLNVPLETVKPESDRTAAEKRLLEVDAKPDPILAAFFGRPTDGL